MYFFPLPFSFFFLYRGLNSSRFGITSLKHARREMIAFSDAFAR